MSFLLKINQIPLEEIYCSKHQQWYQVDNEMNCCASEQEEQLIEEEKYED